MSSGERCNYLLNRGLLKSGRPVTPKGIEVVCYTRTNPAQQKRSVEIRPFREGDTAGVSDLWTKVFAYPAPHNQPATVIQHKLLVQPELFFVALRHEVLVGTVMGGYDGHRGWVYSLAVAPQVRRQGVGTALMHHLERALALRGCPKVNLQVLASNAETVAFYRKLGYGVEERISMGKLLGEPSIQ